MMTAALLLLGRSPASRCCDGCDKLCASYQFRLLLFWYVHCYYYLHLKVYNMQQCNLLREQQIFGCDVVICLLLSLVILPVSRIHENSSSSFSISNLYFAYIVCIVPRYTRCPFLLLQGGILVFGR